MEILPAAGGEAAHVAQAPHLPNQPHLDARATPQPDPFAGLQLDRIRTVRRMGRPDGTDDLHQAPPAHASCDIPMFAQSIVLSPTPHLASVWPNDIVTSDRATDGMPRPLDDTTYIRYARPGELRDSPRTFNAIFTQAKLACMRAEAVRHAQAAPTELPQASRRTSDGALLFGAHTFKEIYAEVKKQETLMARLPPNSALYAPEYLRLSSAYEDMYQDPMSGFATETETSRIQALAKKQAPSTQTLGFPENSVRDQPAQLSLSELFAKWDLENVLAQGSRDHENAMRTIETADEHDTAASPASAEDALKQAASMRAQAFVALETPHSFRKFLANEVVGSSEIARASTGTLSNLSSNPPMLFDASRHSSTESDSGRAMTCLPRFRTVLAFFRGRDRHDR